MKVLFISNFLYRFGPPINLYRIIKKLKKQSRIEISLFSFLDGPIRKWYEEIGIFPKIKNLYENSPQNVRELAKIIKKEQPDLILANTLDSINACYAANICKIPCLLYIYEDWPQINTSLLHFFAFQGADLVLFTNRYLKGIYAPLLKNVPVAIVPEGIPIEEFNPSAVKETMDEVKTKLNLPTDKKIVSIIGTVCNRKRQDLFIFGAHEILKRRDDIIFLIIGWYREEENYYQLLKKYIQAGGLESKVIFLGDQDDIKNFYYISDLIVCPSSNDVSPLVIKEALAFGKPVVVSKINGISKIFKDGKEGLLIEPGNQNQLENAILKILDHYPSFQQNIQAAKEKFSLQKTTSILYNIFQKIKLRKKNVEIKTEKGEIYFLGRNLSVKLRKIHPLIARDFR